MTKQRCIILLIIFCIPVTSYSQSIYDSLKLIYSDAYLFEKFYMNKNEVNFEKAINYELRTIWNDSIRDLAGVAVYENAFGFNWTDSIAMNRRIDSLIEITRYPQIRELAKRIRNYANKSLVGQKMIPIELMDYEGKTISTELYKGESFVINLWVSWDRDCIRDMKAINDLIESEAINFYSISFDEDYNIMVRYLKNKMYNWPVVYAGRWNELWSYFKIRHLPKYIVVDPEGKIIMESHEDIKRIVNEASIIR